jgi:hypothetical protein
MAEWTETSQGFTNWTDPTQYIEFRVDLAEYEAMDIDYEAEELFYEFKGPLTKENKEQLWDDANSQITIWS